MSKPPKLNYAIRRSSRTADTAINVSMFSLALGTFAIFAPCWSVWQGAVLSALGVILGIVALFNSPRLALAWLVTSLNLAAAAFAFVIYH